MSRTDELFLRAMGQLPDDTKKFRELPVRARNTLAKNEIETDQQLFDAVVSGRAKVWRECGPVTVRIFCEYLARKFPTDPPVIAEAKP